MSTPHREYNKQLGKAYQSSLKAKVSSQLSFADDETNDEVMGDIDSVLRAEKTEVRHVRDLHKIEQDFKTLENQTEVLRSLMRLSNNSEAQTKQVARTKAVLSKLVAVPEIAAVIEEATGLNTFNKELCDKVKTLSHRLEGVSAEIKSLENKISLQETTPTEPTQVELQTLDKIVALSIQATPEVRDLAKANTDLLARHLSDARYHQKVERQGLVDWLALDRESPIYPRRSGVPKPKNHHNFLLMATDPSEKVLHYSAVHSFVQSLTFESDEYIRQVICTYEIALPQFAKRMRDETAKDSQTVFTCLRLAELLIRLVPADMGGAKKRVCWAAKSCTTELALSDGFLCKCLRLYIEKSMLFGNTQGKTIVDQIYDVALKEHKFAPHGMDNEILLLADDSQLCLLNKTTKSISVYQEEKIELFMVDSSRIELRIAKIGFCMEILQTSETWWEVNFPDTCEKLFDSEP